MRKNIVLVGLMGAGKSSVGKKLAQKSALEFVDTDELIEKEQKCPISDIFADKGENFFRNLEFETILKISAQDGKIIATGGGSVENIENLKNLKSTGIVFYLKTSPEVLFERIKNENHRPLLQTQKPKEKLVELLKNREKNYALADITVETTGKTPDNIADEILKVYNANN